MSATQTVRYRLPDTLPIALAMAVVCSAVSPSAAQQRNEILESAGRLVIAGKNDEAYELLRGTAIANPRLPPPRVMLARLCAQAARKLPDFQKNLRAILEQAVVENPDNPLVYFELATHALTDGRLTEAIFDAQKGLDLSAAPRWGAERQHLQLHAWDLLAVAYVRRGDWSKAGDYLLRLVEATPKNGLYRRQLALSLLSRQRPDDAEKELCRAERDVPDFGPAAVEMAKLWAQKGDRAKAREWFDKAVKDNPDSFRAHSAYAEWLIGEKDWPAARVCAETAARIRPDAGEVRRLLAAIADGESAGKPTTGKPKTGG